MPKTGDMVQVHLLTAFPAALLNRDDAGLAKRIPFGGHVRIRISSQCLKKHWRDAEEIREKGDQAVRSTRTYELLVAGDLRSRHDATEEEAAAIARYLMRETLQTTGDPEDPNRPLHTKQLTILTRAEIEFLAELAADILRRLREQGATVTTAKEVEKHAKIEDKEIRKMLKERHLPASLDTALFGRMVTSDLFARVDAAVSVAHAFTTHAEEAETDYFTAVDTLKGAEDDAGAGLINDTELTSGVYYTYAVIDMNQLRDNLVGEQKQAVERLARTLVEAMATVSPGAKRGSTAPYAYSEFVLLERGPEQPRTLANAFLEPVRANGTNVLAESAARLLGYRRRMADMYGTDDRDGVATVSTIHDVSADGLERVPLRRALEQVFAGQG
jgi:CRISPR system Cascade subunit CasC